ncbi:unnamed protein product [Blepharisma stoltei]|uniref:Uncharacterized protein n=1 Tax=Blepharisma stoltei TaxID=1481888 RepID=A0AAU9K047_9CILI|nr:unnamed protein product [Blepharisma stoltei]
MEKVESLFSTIQEPTTLLTPSTNIYTQANQCLDSLAKELNQMLFTKGFDEEQIWGQFELINKNFLPKLQQDAENHQGIQMFEESEEELESSVLEENSENEESSQNEEEIEEQSGSEMEEGSENEKSEGEKEGNAVEDKFLKIDELEQFLKDAEMEEEDPALEVSEEEDEESNESEEEENEEEEKDFFKGPDEEESEEEQEKLFTFTSHEDMDKIEDKLVSNKPWQLRGEILSTSRPVNSLLDTKLDFELARNPTPNTQAPEVTDQIEDIIKQRILDLVFDDVKPKLPIEKSKALTSPEDFMSYEKSKKSLAELYEEDYKKDVLRIPMNEEQEKAKQEAIRIFKKLSYSLDLLSSLNPIANPVVKEMEIKSAEVPALVMEEVIPFGVSRESTLNPREVFDPSKAELKAPEELTSTDRNSSRRKHKSTIRTRKKEKLVKLMEKMARDPRYGKFEYRKMLKEQKAKKELIENKKQTETKFTRSSEFFKNLKKINKEVETRKKKEESHNNISKKIKL